MKATNTILLYFIPIPLSLIPSPLPFLFLHSSHIHPFAPLPPLSPGRPPLSPTLSRSRSLDSCREHKLQTMRRSGAPGGGSQSEEEALQSGMEFVKLCEIQLKVVCYKSWGYLKEFFQKSSMCMLHLQFLELLEKILHWHYSCIICILHIIHTFFTTKDLINFYDFFYNIHNYETTVITINSIGKMSNCTFNLLFPDLMHLCIILLSR